MDQVTVRTGPLITVLRSKIHNAFLTDTNADYEGSCEIYFKLMENAGIVEYEQIHIYCAGTPGDNRSGARFTTYAIPCNEPGRICFNGPAAYEGVIGEKLIICTYQQITASDGAKYDIRKVFVNNDNEIVKGCSDLITLKAHDIPNSGQISDF